MNVSIGVIGFGWMAYYHYKNIVPTNGEFEFKAVYDTNSERKEFCEKLGMKSYNSLEGFLADDSFNTVIVATPNDSHMDYAIRAMAAGKHVICEKPIALNALESEDMIRASKYYNKIFTVHQNRRRDRDFLSVQQVIKDGTIGKVFRIENRVNGSNGIPGDWRREKKHGGGMLLDWGPHLIDQVLQLNRHKVVEVIGFLVNVSYDVDDNFQIILRFEDDVTALIEVSTNCFLPFPRWHVLGSIGTLNIENFKNEGIITRGTVKEVDWSIEAVDNYAGSTRTMRPRPNETIESLENPKKETDWAEFYHNYKRVLEGKDELLVKPEESLRVMKIIDLVCLSSKENRSVICSI